MLFVVLALTFFRAVVAGEMTIDCTKASDLAHEQRAFPCQFEETLADGEYQVRCYSFSELIMRIRCHLYKKDAKKNKATDCLFVLKKTNSAAAVTETFLGLPPGRYAVENNKLMECYPQPENAQESLTAKYTDLAGLKPAQIKAALDKAKEKNKQKL